MKTPRDLFPSRAAARRSRQIRRAKLTGLAPLTKSEAQARVQTFIDAVVDGRFR